MKTFDTTEKQLRYELQLLKSKLEKVNLKLTDALEVIEEKDKKIKKLETELFICKESKKSRDSVKVLKNANAIEDFLKAD
jgi:peptidoglycan hydrolase CwlO-like protein